MNFLDPNAMTMYQLFYKSWLATCIFELPRVHTVWITVVVSREVTNHISILVWIPSLHCSPLLYQYERFPVDQSYFMAYS